MLQDIFREESILDKKRVFIKVGYTTFKKTLLNDILFIEYVFY